MTTKTMTQGAGAFILSEDEEGLSRDELTIVSGAGSLLAGTVLGKITASGKYKPYDDDAVDGTQTAAAILIYDTDATSADVKATCITRLAQVATSRLVWGAAVTTQTEKDNAITDLAAKFVIARS